MPFRHEQPVTTSNLNSPLGTVQRQHDDAAPEDSSAVPADGMPPPGGLPVAAPPSAATPAAAPTAPASPPLDELARQLFGPLAARLKAEFRLDRERAGLLTDLRQ
jgi:hypothetical protein